MNDLMSVGLHRLWKRFTLLQTGLRPGQRALDVASGTGDLGAGLARQVGRDGLAVLTDINREMLARGRDRLIDKGLGAQVAFMIANAECLPFPDRRFDCVTIGFRSEERRVGKECVYMGLADQLTETRRKPDR